MEQKLTNEGVIYEFTRAEVTHIRDLVENLLTIIKYDEENITQDVWDDALIVAEILGVPVPE